MAKRNYKYNCIVDLKNIPQKHNGYDWPNSIGKIIDFIFDNGGLIGELKVIDYKIPPDKTNKYIYLEYEENKLKPILPDSLKKGKLSNILDEHYICWEYNVGDKIKDSNRNLTVIDRYRIEDCNHNLRKAYKVKCNVCGYDCSEYYQDGIYHPDKWIIEYDLKRNDNRQYKCACCNSVISVPNINSIYKADVWLSNLFNDKNEALKYTKFSRHKVDFKCPYCNQIINKKIADVSVNGSLPCDCKDQISYPNKFAHAIFNLLSNQIQDYIYEYSPEWAGLYKYDNYFVKDNIKYIVEMDGGLGHGNKTYNGEKDINGKLRDEIKDRLAYENEISLIRVDCQKSDFDYIKNNFCNKLEGIIDFNNINWIEVEERISKNINKEICEIYNSINTDRYDIILYLNKITGYSTDVISSALKIGTRVGWCNYKGNNATYEEKRKMILKLWNEDKIKSTADISSRVGASQSFVVNTLNKYAKDGLCDYDPSLQIFTINEQRCKPIYVYTKEHQFIKKYNSINELVNNSLKDLNVEKICKRNVHYICSGKGQTYKGYYYSYTELN